VDPATAYSPGGAFNQYWYANANPYGLVDADGRDPGDPPNNRSPGPIDCPGCDRQPPPPPPPPVQSPFTAAGAVDAAAQGVGIAGHAIGAGEVAASSEANAWSAISSRGTGAMANAAAENASALNGIARGLGTAGAAVSLGTGAVETYHANNAGDAFHGIATMVLGGAAIAGYVSGPVGLGIGLIDTAAQQARYTSPLTGESSSGWRAINAAGADAINTQYQRDTALGPIIY
jgi:hypothetical protein